MSTLLFELRPPACCENNSPIPPIDLYPSWLCEKCFTANCNVQPSPTSAMMTQNHNCRVCGDKVGVSIFTRPFSYPMLVLSLKEVLNLLRFHNPPYDYKNYDCNNTVVKISLLVMCGRTDMEIVNLKVLGSHNITTITANLSLIPETRRPFLDRLAKFKKRNSGACFSMEDLIGLGMVNTVRRSKDPFADGWFGDRRPVTSPGGDPGPNSLCHKGLR